MEHPRSFAIPFRGKAVDPTLAAPLAAAGAYLLVLIINFPKLLQSVSWNSDAVFFSVLAEELAFGPEGGRVNLGNNAHYSTLWFLLATARIPFHRQLWAVTPYLLSVASVALISWAAWKAAGRWAALITAAVAISAGPLVLFTTLPQAFRSHTWLANAAFVASLVVMGQGGDPAGHRKILLWVAGLTVLAGITLASDPLFALSGLAPFVAAAALNCTMTRGRQSRRLLAACLGIALGAVLVSAGISALMRSLGFTATFPQTLPHFVTARQLGGNLGTFALNLLGFANGLFLGQPVGLRSSARLIGAGLAFTAFALPFLVFKGALRKMFPEGAPAREADQGLLLYVSFWFFAQAAVSLPFLLTTMPVGGGLASSRYLVPLFFASAACAGIWGKATQWRRVITGGAATVFCLLALASQKNLPRFSEGALPQQASKVLNFLASERATRGYAGYWSSHNLSWESGMRVRAYPVWNCPALQSEKLCPFHLAVREVWYEGDVPGKSFLLVDPRVPIALGPFSETTLGPPSSVAKFGDISVYVYDYDIAARFGKTRAWS